MPFTYHQSSGILVFPDGAQMVRCYSGIGPGLDNPAEQSVPNMGPIPVGTYRVGSAFDHPQCGPLTMRLTPEPGTDTFGRDGFCIHGDTGAMNHTASHGCIVVAPGPRAMIAREQQQDNLLNVAP